MHQQQNRRQTRQCTKLINHFNPTHGWWQTGKVTRTQGQVERSSTHQTPGHELNHSECVGTERSSDRPRSGTFSASECDSANWWCFFCTLESHTHPLRNRHAAHHVQQCFDHSTVTTIGLLLLITTGGLGSATEDTGVQNRTRDDVHGHVIHRRSCPSNPRTAVCPGGYYNMAAEGSSAYNGGCESSWSCSTTNGCPSAMPWVDGFCNCICQPGSAS
jgi:hypothetical protein